MKEKIFLKRIKAFGEGLSPQYQFVKRWPIKGGSMMVPLAKYDSAPLIPHVFFSH
jgi:hypothetical protein